jgi:predicted  nucleic acid-binding Zn-ribbon protein
MKSTNIKLVAIIAALLLAIVFAGVYFAKNKSLKKNLQNEQVVSEALLSEKLMLDKSLAKFKSDMAAMQGMNARLDKTIEDAKQKLAQKEAEVKKLMSENASLRSLKTKIKEIEALKDKLTEELSSNKIAYDKLKLENKTISEQLATVQKEKEQLMTNNTILKAMAGNNYRVEAVRGKKDKLTAIARRTKKLVFTFDLPKDVGNGISFKLIAPDGKVFASNENKSAEVKVTENPENFYANVKAFESVGTKRIEMIYIPNEKLIKGVYKFEVYDNANYIGTNQFKLR